MRLTEVAPNFVMSEVGTLMTILKHIEGKMGKGTSVPFQPIANFMRNVGYNLTFDDFMQLYNNDENLQKLISGVPSENEITINSDVPDIQGDGEENADAMVDKMAQTAAKKVNN